jgi:glutaconate CoA-transferase subunit A
MTASRVLPDPDALAGAIPDGTKLALYKDSGVAMAATRALIRRGARGLHIVTAPTSGFQAELLIAAGCVATIETSGVSLGEFGQAPAFVRAVKSGAVQVRDATCPAIYAQLQAAEKGIPFMPLRGLIGSDLMRVRPEFKVIDNPFGENDPIVALPAIVPDVTIFHAAKADRAGNVFVGGATELKMMAHAARRTFVTVEAIVDEDLTADEAMAGAVLPALHVDGIAVAEKGAWPLDLPGHYPEDRDYLQRYAAAAATPEGLAEWLAAEGLRPRAQAAE